jgi:predicted metal-binding membrane protein
MTARMGMAATESKMHMAMGMPEMAQWGQAELLALFVMWAVMMVAMMLPSAAPVILLATAAYRRRGSHARTAATAFVSGYIVVWTAFSAAAALAQFGLHRAALLSPNMSSSSAALGGVILMLAGIYQWLPIKQACLTHCRSPLGFLGTEWREGVAGAFVMGARHGMFCLGCCWALMLLLFVVGVMNVLWVAVLAVVVLLEKLAPRGERIARAIGAALFVWGLFVLTRGNVMAMKPRG